MSPAPFFPRWVLALLAWGAVLGAVRAADRPVALTEPERAWVAAHPKIRVGYDPAWPPFSTRTERGACVGIDADLLGLLARRIGLTVEFVPAGSWTEAYEKAKRRDCDLLVGTALTPERAEAFRFTEPYLSFPVVIVTRNDEPLLWSVLDLAGRRVAGVKGYVTTVELVRQYPGIQLVPVENVSEAMALVADNKADAFVTNLPNASFIAKTRGLTNLKIAGVMPERFDLRYAVRPDWPELAALLDKAIATLNEADRQAIVHPWIRVDYEKVIRWDLVWKTAATILGGFALVLAAVIYHNRRLARELEERKRLQREIEQARDELLRLNEDKTELLQMAAHDLRGPLTGMQLAIDTSLRLNAMPMAEALKIIEKQARQMTGLLNDLLDVEALEHGRREFRVERVSPAAKLREALGALKTYAEHKDIRLDVAIDEGLPEVEVDATALRQIYDNLLSNALKFSPRGSVVTVTLEQRASFVRLEVRDQGPGVAGDETERIFAKYARGRARPTDGEKSTGLGLSIVRQLAGAMNARVWCEAQAGGGGLFIMVLPAGAKAV